MNIKEIQPEVKRNGTLEADGNLSSNSDSLFGIPGLPFLIASVCIVFAIIAAYFVKDIKKGRVGDEESSEEAGENNSTSNSHSASDSQTKVNIKSSVIDVKEFVEAGDRKYDLRKCWLESMIQIKLAIFIRLLNYI